MKRLLAAVPEMRRELSEMRKVVECYQEHEGADERSKNWTAALIDVARHIDFVAEALTSLETNLSECDAVAAINLVDAIAFTSVFIGRELSKIEFETRLFRSRKQVRHETLAEQRSITRAGRIPSEYSKEAVVSALKEAKAALPHGNSRALIQRAGQLLKPTVGRDGMYAMIKNYSINHHDW